MLREIIQSQLPLLIIICLLTYLVYYLHKRILRIETYLKKINENQLLQQKEINTTQAQVAQVAQPIIPEPVIPEPTVPSYRVESQAVHPEQTEQVEQVNPLLGLFAALQKEMNAPRQSPARIEEIDEEDEDEEDEESEDEEDDSDSESDTEESEESVVHQPVVQEQEVQDHSETEEEHQEDDHKPSSKKNFNKMTVKELQAIATENGLNIMKKTRKELIAMLEEKANSA